MRPDQTPMGVALRLDQALLANPPRPMASPAAKSGQWNGFGRPPAMMLGASQQKASTTIRPPAMTRDQSSPPSRIGRPAASAARTTVPDMTIEAATSTGASTGADQGTGSRNSRSQVRSD